MRPDDIRDMLRRQPLQAFRLYVLETTAFEIRHPDQVLVTNSVLDIYVPGAESPALPSGRNVRISLLHVSQMEVLAAAPSANGE